MQIIVAKDSGFCYGVQNAIEVAVGCEGGCVTLGKLIHNESVLARLKERNVVDIASLSDYRGGKLVIRAHGVGKSVYDELKARGIEYLDATCVFVKKIHQIVAEYYAKGYNILIVGNREHPEVIGINGWCGNTAKIISNAEEIDNLDNGSYCVVAQTTFDRQVYEKIVKKLESWCKSLVIHNTICYTTNNRQQQAEELSKTCDAMLVIGSKSSSNTAKLFDICSANCRHTYYIQTTADLQSVYVAKKFKRLGVIAGASTPHELIKEVVTLMSESQEITKVESNVEKNDFGAMLEAESAKMVDIKAGKLFKDCTVVKADEDGITISFTGGKKEGFIDKNEVELDGVAYDPAQYSVGDVISAIVIEKSGKKGNDDYIAFSKKAVDKRAKELAESEEMLKGNEFKAVISGVVKGGLTTKIGPFNIFVPASQIRVGYVTEEDLKKYEGKTLRLRVIKGKKEEQEGDVVIKRNKTVIASQRVILEEEKAAKEEALWSTLQVGAIVTGKVKRFAAFGAFVSVNGFDCLAHISDLSYYKVEDPSEVLELNKSYEFVVLKADRENQKVSLGYKQLQKKPYEIAAEKYPVGSVITGTVRSVFPYGAFVLIERDVDGLVPVSEISHNYTKNAADVYKVGDEVTAQIIKFEGNKITLSVKALITKEENNRDDEVEMTEEEYKEAKEKRAQRTARKFEKPVGGAPVSKKSRVKKDQEEEVSSWTSEQSSATLGDLFKGLNLDIKD